MAYWQLLAAFSSTSTEIIQRLLFKDFALFQHVHICHDGFILWLGTVTKPEGTIAREAVAMIWSRSWLQAGFHGETGLLVLPPCVHSLCSRSAQSRLCVARNFPQKSNYSIAFLFPLKKCRRYVLWWITFLCPLLPAAPFLLTHTGYFPCPHYFVSLTLFRFVQIAFMKDCSLSDASPQHPSVTLQIETWTVSQMNINITSSLLSNKQHVVTRWWALRLDWATVYIHIVRPSAAWPLGAERCVQWDNELH